MVGDGDLMYVCVVSDSDSTRSLVFLHIERESHIWIRLVVAEGRCAPISDSAVPGEATLLTGALACIEESCFPTGLLARPTIPVVGDAGGEVLLVHTRPARSAIDVS